MSTGKDDAVWIHKLAHYTFGFLAVLPYHRLRSLNNFDLRRPKDFPIQDCLLL